MSDSGFCSVYITCPGRESALTLARAVVSKQLAACANIFDGMTSVYSWNGELVEETETVLVFKTRTVLFEALRNEVSGLHPYKIPCIVMYPIEAGHPPYLSWIVENTKG